MLVYLILGFVFYISSLVFGISLVNYFLGRFLGKRIFQYAAGIPVGFVLSSYAALALEVLGGSFFESSLAIVAPIWFLLSFFLLKNTSNGNPFGLSKLKQEFAESRGLHTSIIILSAALIVMQAFGLNANNNGIWSSLNYGGDLLFHLGIGQSLIYSGFPPTYLYSYTATNVFPFITDFYTAILQYSGFGIMWAFNAMNFLLWFSFTAMLIFFFNLISRNYKISAIAVLMFLFFSQGFNFLVLWLFHWGLPYVSADQVQNLAQNFMNLVTYPYFNFSDPFVSNFSIQHDYLLAFPYTLVIVSVLYLIFLEPKGKKKESISLGVMAFLGVLVGLMPLLHPFSLEFIFAFCAVLFVYSVIRSIWKKTGFVKAIVPWLIFGIAVLLFAIPMLNYIFSQPLKPGFISLAINQGFWYPQIPTLSNIVISHVQFWFEALGPMLLFGIIGLWYFRRESWIAFAPAIITFLVVNLYSLQPSFGDNNKTTVYFVLFLSLAATITLYKLATLRKGRVQLLLMLVALMLFISATFSGFVADYWIFTNPYIVATPLELTASNWIINNTAPHAIFQSNCYTYTLDFVSTIAARDTLLDIYTYTNNDGIMPQNYNPDSIAQSLSSFFSSPNCSIIKQYGISYIVLENITQKGSMYNCAAVNWLAFSNSSNFQKVYSGTDNRSSQIEVLKTAC